MRIVFMGTPAFAVPALEGLLASAHEVVGVYSQPPRPAGRGQKLTPSPVHLAAETAGVPVFTPLNFKQADDVAQLRALIADIAVVAAYGLLLPKTVLESFPKGCINIHPSALPRWRGAAPLHRTILAGDTQTDICIMQMDEGLDTGDVILRKSFTLPSTMTTGELHDMAAHEAVPLLLEALQRIENGTATWEKQAADGVTYAKKITKDESFIHWNLRGQEILNLIRGLHPYPLAQSALNDEPVKFHKARFEPRPHNAQAGQIVDAHCAIACADGVIIPEILQRAGKKPMAVDDMLRGNPVTIGDCFTTP